MEEEIRQLVVFAKTNKSPQNVKLRFAWIDADEAAIIRQKTGLELLGYARVIDKFGINHTRKNHGNPATEKLRGQIAITDEDFELIPEIAKAENVIYVGKNKIGNDTLLYETIIDGTFY